MSGKDIFLVLGDQLTESLVQSYADPERHVILMAEVLEEATYVAHHKQKIAFCFAAMRQFASTLTDLGYEVAYTEFDAEDNSGSLSGEISKLANRLKVKRLIYIQPGEHRVAALLEALSIETQCLEDTRFICPPGDFELWADGRKSLRMEYFYREMRRKTGLLMAGDTPEGGKWNFDTDNRKPANADLFMPKLPSPTLSETTITVLDLVEQRFGDHFGRLRPFIWATTSEQAQDFVAHFMSEALPSFGSFQDAMLIGENFLYHSCLSTYLNAGLLDPLDVCRRAEAEYYAGNAPLNSVEGFIRQIIGWREYVRGIYFLEGSEYVRRNYFENSRSLPEFYWTAETEMNCMGHAIGQTRDLAYAHHIQRLMVTGNFALIAGIDPHQVHEWYLAVYSDAYEWVEAPNTIGMSLFADGGLVASKPYASSGAYIDRMSDYCKSCRYDVKDRAGERACPFNSLYWHFLHRNRDKLGSNHRMGNMYRTWDRMSEPNQSATLDRAQSLLERLDNGEKV